MKDSVGELAVKLLVYIGIFATGIYMHASTWEGGNFTLYQEIILKSFGVVLVLYGLGKALTTVFWNVRNDTK